MKQMSIKIFHHVTFFIENFSYMLFIIYMKNDFWSRVRHGTELLGIHHGTFRTWKSRKSVPKKNVAELYLVLKGTEFELSLEDLLK